MKVKNVMTAQSVKFCTKDANLQEVAKKMKVNNCGALPVVDEENKVVGIITDRDICLSISKKSIIPAGDRKVKDAMTKKLLPLMEVMKFQLLTSKCVKTKLEGYRLLMLTEDWKGLFLCTNSSTRQ